MVDPLIRAKKYYHFNGTEVTLEATYQYVGNGCVIEKDQELGNYRTVTVSIYN